MRVKTALFRSSFAIISPILFLSVFASSVIAFEKPVTSITPHEPPPTKLTGTMRICEVKQAIIKTRLTHLIDLATNIEDKFGLIAGRVETFYTNKVVSSGKSVANYDSLVADIQTKKDAVATEIAKAKTDANAFSCSSSDPKTLFNSFRIDMQSVKQALKEYRTSIKNLIVAVHSVAGGEENNGTPKPTKVVTPEPTH